MSSGNAPALAGSPSRISTTTPATGAPIVVLRGEINRRCAMELRRIFRRLGREHRSVILDVADVAIVDRAVLTAIVAASDRLPGGVWVRGATGIVRRLFVLAGREHMLLM